MSSRISAAFATALEAISAKLRLRYLGLGFLWAWIYCTWMSPLVFPESMGLTTNKDISWIISAAAVTVSLFVSPLLFKRDFISIGWVKLIAPLGTTLGSIAQAQAILFGVDLPLVQIVGGVVTGICSGWLWIMWGEFFGVVDPEITHFSLPLTVAVPLICMLSTMAASGPIAGAAVCCLPLVSGACLVLSVSDQLPSVARGVPSASSGIVPSRVCLLDFFKLGLAMIATYVVISFCWSMFTWGAEFGWSEWFIVAYAIGGLMAIVAACMSLLFARAGNVFGLYRWLVPFALFAYAALSFQSYGGALAAWCLITIVQYGFDIVVWVYFADIVNAGLCSGRLAAGINRGLVQLAVLLGSALGVVAPKWFEAGIVSFPSFLILLLAVLITAVFAVFSSSRSSNPFAALRKKDEELVGELDREAGEAADRGVKRVEDTRPLVCERLAKEHALTKREAEIMSLLACGRSIPFVANSLYISKNTVDSHVKSIYRKLDVHSRQDLLDRVQNEENA